MAFPNIRNGGRVALLRCLVDAVKLVFTLAFAVRRNDHGFQTVNFLKLIRLGVGSPRHAAHLVVQAEVILKGDRRQRLVLCLDLHALFGFHRLVQAIAPAATGHQATGELVHDDDLTLLNHIVLVAVVQMLRSQSSVQVVHQRDVGGVIEAGAFRNQAHLCQHCFSLFVALLGQENLVCFFIQREVPRGDDAFTGARIGFAFLTCEQRHNLLHRQVGGRVVFGLAADDQRGTGFVDQDRVDLIDDGVVQGALHTVMGFIDHVVAQVIETVFVVRAVGDVRVVGRLLFFTRHLREVDADRHAQEVEKLAHPACIAAGQVIVHSDDVQALASQCIQVSGQCGGQGFALARAHFGNLAVVQGDATRQLDIEVPHLHDPLGAFTNNGKGFRQQGIQCFTGSKPIPETLGLGSQLIVAQRLQSGFQ